jgi:hypothetical protein
VQDEVLVVWVVCKYKESHKGSIAIVFVSGTAIIHSSESTRQGRGCLLVHHCQQSLAGGKALPVLASGALTLLHDVLQPRVVEGA